MGLLDFFRKRASGQPQAAPAAALTVPQLCYDVAYFILPQYVYNDRPKLVDLYTKSPLAVGPFFYSMACQLRGAPVERDVALRFRAEHEVLDRDHEHYTIEYPSPPPVDLSNLDERGLAKAVTSIVLAPYFSTMILHRRTNEVGYFILGQAPMGGGTTLRSVLRDGSNANLGPGPQPRLDLFLNAVRERR